MTTALATAEQRLDAWENAITGVGGRNDKSSLFYFVPGNLSSDSQTLDYMYDQDHIAGKIVDAMPDQVFLRGWELTTSDDDLKEGLIDVADSLEVEKHVDQALRWEGLYGGAAIFIGADDGQSITEELKVDSIKTVHYLKTFDRWELSPHSYYDEALHPKHGEPRVYRVHPRTASTNVGLLVHESRLVMFKGRPTTKTQLIQNQFWGQSRLVRAYTSIKHYGASLASVLALMADASQGVYKIKGLYDIIKSGNADDLRFRMAAMDEVRSLVNAIIMDADGEDYSRIATPLTELANLVDRFKMDVSSAAETPATVLFGQAPAGLNATGESDMRMWYDKVAQCQRKRVIPAITRIMRCVLASKTGPTRGVQPEKWDVDFPSPWQPTASEEAEIRNKNAQTDALYVDLQVLTPFQIARARMDGGASSTAEIILTPAELKALENAQLTMGLPPLTPEEAAAGVNALGAIPGTNAPALPAVPDAEVVAEDAAAEVAPAAPIVPLALVHARQFAEEMTANGLERCQHDKPNRCPICQIERTRTVARGPDGEPVFGVKWIASADAAEAAPEPPSEGADTDDNAS